MADAHKRTLFDHTEGGKVPWVTPRLNLQGTVLRKQTRSGKHGTSGSSQRPVTEVQEQNWGQGGVVVKAQVVSVRQEKHDLQSP